MRKINWMEGLRSAGLIALINAALSVAAFQFGCAFFWKASCAPKDFVPWFAAHPVFPNLIPMLILFGFVFGATSDIIVNIWPKTGPAASERLFVLFCCGLIILLIAAFVVFALPDLVTVWQPLPEYN